MHDVAMNAQQNNDPNAAAALALVVLTGIETHSVTRTQLDLDYGVAYVPDVGHYPLAQQAIDLLRDCADLSHIDVHDGLQTLGMSAEDARYALMGAIWETSEEGRFLRDTLAMGDLPTLPFYTMFPFSVLDKLHPDDTDHWQHSRATMQAAADWLLGDDPPIETSLVHKLLDGKLIFLLVSTGVSGLNLIHNLAMGRLLTPADYGQMTFLNTLLLVIGLLPTAMQTVVARFSAIYESQNSQNRLQQLWHFGQRRARMIGLVLALIFMLFSGAFVEWFQLRDSSLMLPIVLAIPFFLLTGSQRGLLQGKEQYYWLSAAYLIEGVVRLGLGVLLAWVLLDVGRELDGAVWALSQSVLLTWFVGWLALRTIKNKTSEPVETIASEDQQEWTRLFGFTMMALLGQALITNSDFVLVKMYFDSLDAGLYAAVSVIGRIVYFGTLPLTILIVPMIAKKQARGESTRTLFVLLMGSGAVLCGGLIAASTLFGEQIISILYGANYVDAAFLLPMYTVAAALFVMTNLLVTYRVGLGKGSETWMPLAAGIAQIIGVVLFHDSLQTIITIQITIMSALFVGVAWRARR